MGVLMVTKKLLVLSTLLALAGGIASLDAVTTNEFLEAALLGNVPIVREYLAQRGANVNAADDRGMTALHWVAGDGREAVVRLLLQHGADVNAASTDGVTALHWVAGDGREAVVRLLLQHGANVNAAITDGSTALDRAAARGHVDVVRLLLDRGAIIDAVTTGGRTALHKAVEHGHVDVVRLLLDRGASVDADRIHAERIIHAPGAAASAQALERWRAANGLRGVGSVECPICLEYNIADGIRMVRLNCGHVFCLVCCIVGAAVRGDEYLHEYVCALCRGSGNNLAAAPAPRRG